MKTKLFVLLTAILTLGTFSSCDSPYGYGNSYRRTSYSRNTNMGGYRGGGSGGGFGGSFGGFNR